MKKALSVLILSSALVAGISITSDAQAVGVAYYNFSGWYGYSASTKIVSNSWTSNSTNNTVAINGWQDDFGNPPANVDYEVVESATLGWNSNWVPWNCSVNYPQNGSWYGHQFTGIPNGRKIAIRLTTHSPYPSDGAGNAYQS